MNLYRERSVSSSSLFVAFAPSRKSTGSFLAFRREAMFWTSVAVPGNLSKRKPRDLRPAEICVAASSSLLESISPPFDLCSCTCSASTNPFLSLADSVALTLATGLKTLYPRAILCPRFAQVSLYHRRCRAESIHYIRPVRRGEKQHSDKDLGTTLLRGW